jgi:predicted short-subunit dehydrogenase-like oxidoreductase (DUF2520 family)
MSKQVTIAVIGRGKVGSSFAEKIAAVNSKYKLFVHLPARRKSFEKLSQNGGPDVIFICAKDDEIVRVSRKVLKSAGKNLKLLIHCAGSRESTILPARKGVSRLTLHPIQTFAEADISLLNNIYFMASSNDPFAKKWAKVFVKDIGGKGLVEVRGRDLPLYHTLVVFASNFVTLLGGAIELLSKSIGIRPSKMKSALEPLMWKSLQNVLKKDAAKVLTGPLARKDFSTVLKHRLALQSQPAALRKIYEGFVMLANEII